MATTSMSLSRHWQDFIQTQIDSGRYASASEVLRESLRLMELREQKLAALRAHVAEGLAQIERGEGIRDLDIEAFIAEGEERLAERLRKTGT
jgi:antitoxin ParD1/3/4